MRVAAALAAVALPAAVRGEAYRCDVAVVGAGPGGAYLANRLASSGNATVCVFEQLGRVGGRVHSLRESGPRRDLVVEAGAYRFAVRRTCPPMGEFCIYTPVTAGVIMEHLRLPWRRYDPLAAWDAALAVITDAAGRDAGYATFVERLVAAPGVALRSGRRLTRVAGSPGAYELRFANGDTASAPKVVLNLPQTPLLRVVAQSPALAAREEEVPEVLDSVAAYPVMKLYVHYQDAWWRNVLGLSAGAFNNSAAWVAPNPEGADMREYCLGSRQRPAPLRGSYHDGDVRCGGPPGAECRGYIQAAYTGDAPAVRYYQKFHVLSSGDSVVHLDAASPRAARLLRRVHEALVELHAGALRARGDAALRRAIAAAPDGGVLSVWDQRADGLEAGCHQATELGASGGVFPARGIDPHKIPPAALEPFPRAPGVFVVNEAYGTLPCFAEGSLVMAENVAHTGFGLRRPAWINETVYRRDVIFSAASPSPAQLRAHPGGDPYFAGRGV